MDINAANLRSIYTGLSTAFNTRLANTQTYYGQVAMMANSVTAMNEYPRLDDLPGFREWIGDRVIHDLSAQSYIIRNRKFESTIGILRDQIEGRSDRDVHARRVRDGARRGRVPGPADLPAPEDRRPGPLLRRSVFLRHRPSRLRRERRGDLGLELSAGRRIA